MPVPTDYALEVVRSGFIDRPEAHYDPEELAAAKRLTPEGTVTPPERLPKPSGIEQTCAFRETLEEALLLGDFVLSIDVRRTAADVYLYAERAGFSKRFHIEAEIANRYLDTLKIYDGKDGKEVQI